MYSDLICFNAQEAASFSKLIAIDIIKAASRLELEKGIKRASEGLIIAEGSELNRAILENKKIDILVSSENNSKKDFMHYRNSGLNQVLCKLANKNSIAIAFSFNDVLKAKGTERSKIMGRMMQNVKLCKKYKVNMVISSFATSKFELKSPSDLISFGIILGMTPKEAKESILNIDRIFEINKDKLSGGVKLKDE